MSRGAGFDEDVSKSVIWVTRPMLQPSIAASRSEAGMGNGDRNEKEYSIIILEDMYA